MFDVLSQTLQFFIKQLHYLLNNFLSQCLPGSPLITRFSALFLHPVPCELWLCNWWPESTCLNPFPGPFHFKWLTLILDRTTFLSNSEISLMNVFSALLDHWRVRLSPCLIASWSMTEDLVTQQSEPCTDLPHLEPAYVPNPWPNKYPI